MKPEFWLERWSGGRIGFHQNEVEPGLLEFFPMGSGRVFVPLCGKSKDLAWLAGQGREVVGVELSPLACEGFFSENFPGQLVSRRTIRDFEVYSAGGVTIYCGDFFKIGREALVRVTTVYDRAALIALPPELRVLYVAHLGEVVSPEVLLLVTLEYPQEKMQGPPFSVGPAEVQSLYGDTFEIEHCSARDESASFESDSKLYGSKVKEHVFRCVKRVTKN